MIRLTIDVLLSHYHCCHGEPSRACQPLTPPPMKSDGKPNNAMAPLPFRHTGKFARLSKHETPASLMAHPLALSKPGLSNPPTEPNECSKRNARTSLAPIFRHKTQPFPIALKLYSARRLLWRNTATPAFHLPNLVGDLTHSKRVLGYMVVARMHACIAQTFDAKHVRLEKFPSVAVRAWPLVGVSCGNIAGYFHFTAFLVGAA